MRTKKRVLLAAVAALLMLSSAATAWATDGFREPLDVVVNDDYIISFSLCVGQDCVDGEDFGFDTLRLKENNLRIHFQDTSNSASFPSTDWRITINDSSNGGANYFGVDNATANEQYLTVMDGGNTGIGTTAPAERLHVNGNVQVDGTVNQLSDVNVKEAFKSVDGRDLLNRLSEVAITEWRYKHEGDEVRHVGPTAQDFYAAFGLGGSERHITTVDSAGVSLAAVQALYELAQTQEAEINALEEENAELNARLAALEAAVADLTEEK